MAPVIVNPANIREFRDFGSFYDWLRENHQRAEEVWIRIFKLASGIPSITPKEAIDAELCWGWVDGIRKSHDDVSFLQRYTPRRKGSVWSEVNRDNVERLTAAGLMQPAGQAEVDRAKADGRWHAAYRVSTAEVPADFQAAIDANPAAAAFFPTLTSQNRFALIFRTNALKTPAGRAKKIAQFVEMLARGETIYPQGRKKPEAGSS